MFEENYPERLKRLFVIKGTAFVCFLTILDVDSKQRHGAVNICIHSVCVPIWSKQSTLSYHFCKHWIAWKNFINPRHEM